MKLNSLDAKQVRFGLHGGMTPGDFCEKYECSEEELRRRIRQLYKHDSSPILDELEANRKKVSGKKKRMAQKTAETMAKLPEISPLMVGSAIDDARKLADEIMQNALGARTPSLTLNVTGMTDGATEEVAMAEKPTAAMEEAKDKPAEVATNGPEEAAVNKPEDTATNKPAETLEEQEARLSDKVISLEKQHREMAGRHRKAVSELRTLREEIEELETSFQAKCIRYESLVEECNHCVVSMRNLTEERSIFAADLEHVRQEIAAAKAVVLLAYADGRIEAPERPDFTIDDSGFTELLTKILQKLECADLRVREVRMIARALRITHNAPEGVVVSVIFDTPEMEKVFQLLLDKGLAD